MAGTKSKEALVAWLEGLEKQGKLPTEKLEALKSTLTPDDLPSEVVEYIGGSVLRQEDYSKLSAQARAKEREAAEFQAALTEWKTDAEKQYLEMQRAKAHAEAEVARLQALAKSYEIPETEYGRVTMTPTEPTDKKEPQVDMSDYLKAKDAQQAMIDALKVQNKLIAIAARHQTLFGKPLEDEQLVDRAIASGRTIEQEWEDHYKVADKRAEMAQAAQEAHDQRIREEERAKLLSELKLPETRPGTATSPISAMFKTTQDAQNDNVSGLQAALEAYGNGKYRTGSSS